LGVDDLEVQYAGIEAHGKNPRAIAVMQEAGMDIGAQAATPTRASAARHV
jgi:arsenate reductase